MAVRWSGGEVTYGGLLESACAVGRRLDELGVHREERVLVVMDDSPAFMAAFLGSIRVGAVPVPVNPMLQHSEDYDHYIEDSLARVVVVDAATAGRVAPAVARASRPIPILTADEIMALPPTRSPVAPTRRDDMAFWLYSSGSTGKPKAVVHLQHDIEYTCETYAAKVLGIESSDTTFSTTKLFHAYGLGNNLSFPFWAGATAVLMAGRPAPALVLETIARYRPSLLFSAPTLYNAVLNHPGAPAADLSCLRLCIAAAEALPAEVWRRWRETFGLTILDGVGSTEMLHIYCSNRIDQLKPGSSGVPVPGYELRIVGESREELAAGQPGELEVRGDSALALYWGQHEKSRRSILGEWFVTGDRYRRDEDGFYWYEGRSDDMIKVSGLWVSPVEIEAALLEHPAVGESAVIGTEVDGFMRIRAFIIPRVAPSPELARELQEHCRSRLQRYQYPHLIEFVTDLPKTVTGKIQRYRLRDQVSGSAR